MLAPLHHVTRRASQAGIRWRPSLRLARNICQVAIALYLVFAGWQFYRFVEHFLTLGAAPFVTRPAVVEAFLPLSALVAMRAWLGTGMVDTVHPAGLMILAAALGTSVLFGKAFCAWLCPVGTLSEGAWRLGRRFLGRSPRLPKWVDWSLQSVKYLLLLFFIKSILFDFTPAMAQYFARTSYNQIADVKMLYFFLRPGADVAVVLVVLIAVSLILPNLWCRYFCPYGAALSLLSVFAPLKVARAPDRCSGCGACSRACPEGLAVANCDRVDSALCTRCLDCINACPCPGALAISAPRLRLPAQVYATLFLVAFFGVLAVAQLAGYWQTSITYDTYARLIPRFDFFNHAW